MKILNKNKIKLSDKTKNIFYRLISSIIYAYLFLYLILNENHFFFNVFICFLAIGSIYELVKMNRYKKNNTITILTTSYILLAFLTLITMKNQLNGSLIILILIIQTWSTDIGGYVIGNFFGQKSLTKISPKKTWEGLIGSIIFCLITGFLIKDLINQNIGLNWFFISIIICFSSILGDLTISKIKRINNKKESGCFLPGHGGFLDRLDSLFLSSLIFYLFICK